MKTKIRTKSICALFLTLCMLFSAVPSVFANGAEQTLTLSYVSAAEFFVNEGTAVLGAQFDGGLLDARKKLTMTLKDSTGVTAAEQISCSYPNSYSTDTLSYTLKVSEGYTLSAEETYTPEFTYTGAYTFENQNEDTFSPSATEEITDAVVVDKNTMTINLYIANYDDTAQYTVDYNDVKYDAESIGEGWVSVTLGEENSIYEYEYNTEYYHIILCKKSAESYECLSWYQFEVENPAESYYSNDYNGVTCTSKIPLSCDALTVSAYNYSENGTVAYNESDVENMRVYMLDNVTLKTVGEAPSVTLRNSYMAQATVEINETLENDKRYLVVVDDGADVRLKSVTATDKFCYSSCLVKDGYDNYSNEITNAASFDCRIYNVGNAPDISKLNVVIRDENGEEAAVLEEGSITQSDNSNSYNFKIKRTADAITSETDYIMYVYYDGSLAGRQSLYCYGGTGNYFYLRDMYQTESEIYALINKWDLENVSSNPYEYKLKNSVTSEEITGAYQREIGGYFVVKFEGSLTEESLENTEWYITAVNSEASLRSEGNINYYDVENVSKPFVYNYVYDIDNVFYMYGEGLSDGAYTMCGVYDRATGDEKETALNFTEGTLSVNADDLKSTTMGEYVFIECDGVLMTSMSGYYFEVGDNHDEFYSEYRNQNHRLAILNLPSDIYAEYKVAASEEELENAEYAPIRESVLYTLSDAEGKQTIYARFKAADGAESDILSAGVNYDTTAPTVTISDLSGTYKVERGVYITNPYFTIPVAVTSDEEGKFYYVLYDANNVKVDGGSASIAQGDNSTSLYIYSGEVGDLTKITRVVCYAEDKAGNMSEEQSFDITIINPYYTYEIPGGSMVFDTESGSILEINTEYDWAAIPHTINGITVTAIDEYALQNSSLSTLRIPETVTSMEYYWRMESVTLQVKEGSYALTFAQDNNLTYEIVTTAAGDVNDDGFINSDDAVYLTRYLDDSEKYPLYADGDLDGSGEADMADALYIIKNTEYEAAEEADALNITVADKTVYEGDKFALLISADDDVQIKTLTLYDMEYGDKLTFNGAEAIAKSAAIKSYDAQSGEAVTVFDKNTVCADALKLSFTAGEAQTEPQSVTCKAAATVVDGNGIEKKLTVNITAGAVTIAEKPAEPVIGISFTDKDGSVITSFTECGGEEIAAKVNLSDETFEGEGKINLYFAQYDENDAVTAVSIEKNVTENGDYTITPVESSVKMKVFVWEEDMTPIMGATELK